MVSAAGSKVDDDSSGASRRARGATRFGRSAVLAVAMVVTGCVPVAPTPPLTPGPFVPGVGVENPSVVLNGRFD